MLGCEDSVILLLGAFLPLVILNFFGLKGSSVYAVLGALSAYSLNMGFAGSGMVVCLFSIIAALVVAFVISYLIRYILRNIFSHVNLHLITLSFYMRHAVIVGVILLSAGLGLNWGGFLNFLADSVSSHPSAHYYLLAIAALIMLVSCRPRLIESDEPSGQFANYSIYAIVSVIYSVALTLLFFSFAASTSILGLTPVPLSLASLTIFAVAGAELAQNSRLVDNEEYTRNIVPVFAAPLGAFLFTFIILHIIGSDSDEVMTDFIVMAIVIATMIAIAFAGYVRKQALNKKATDRIVYAQQQQIYEHSRALNDMELKVVLSENQALQNAVEQKRQEVMNVALSIVEQKEFLESLDDMVSRLAKSDDPEEKDRLVAELSSALKQRLSYDRDVDSQYFYAQAETLHEDFNAKLAENFPDLTQQERRLATLLRLGFPSKYIATLMSITPKSVEISRYRLRQKLGLSKGDNLVNFIKSI
jgi:DNA-binding CsgD family transcriptional regulator